MKQQSEKNIEARCEGCGRKLRKDEGKICRPCMGKVAKILNSYKKEDFKNEKESRNKKDYHWN